MSFLVYLLKCSEVHCVLIFLPWYDIKVTVMRLQVLPEDLPAQFDTPPLARCVMGGAAHVTGSGGGLGHIQDVDVIVFAEQLHPDTTKE